MKRSLSLAICCLVFAFGAGIAAADEHALATSARSNPSIMSLARPRITSDGTTNQIVKYDPAGTNGMADAAMSESGGNVFLTGTNAHLVFWPGTSGSYITGDGYSGLTLYGMGGTITLRNADTVIYGFGTGTTAALHVRNVNSMSLLYVENDGKVGIGTTTPAATLHVKGDLNSSNGMRISNVNAGTSAFAALQFGINGNDFAGAIFQNSSTNTAYGGAGSVNIGTIAAYPVSIMTANTPRLYVFANGNVGIGASPVSPLYGTPFEVAAPATTSAQARQVMRLWDTSGTDAGVGAGIDFGGKFNTAGNYTQFANIKGLKANAISGDTAGKLVLSPRDGGGGFPEVVTITPTGMTVNGSITGTTVVNAVYQDVAEWVPATKHMEPGTVVVLNRTRKNEVMPSARAYDTAVAGVVSAQPGVLLGVGGDSKAKIATTGRVKVHVDATAGPIEIGDLLVTSDKSGTAMKSQPVDLGGVSFHRPGTVIGKALEPLAAGQGEILVLLSLQ